MDIGSLPSSNIYCYMDTKLKSFVIATLRKASYRHPGRSAALKKAHVGRNQYICAHCGPDKIHTRNDIKLDHIIPVVSVTEGFTTFDDFIERLFCDESGYQVLCTEHHDIKTKQENEIRKQTKQAKKK